MSLQEVADAMRSKRPTVQRYFEPEYRENGVLPVELAIKLAGVFEGKGDPPIRRNEVMDLTGLPRVADQTGYSRMPYEVAEAISEALARLSLEGRDPPRDVVEVGARMMTSLSELYESDHAVRQDPEQTRVALKVLALQFGRQAH